MENPAARHMRLVKVSENDEYYFQAEMHHEWGIILSSVREIPWLIDAGLRCDWNSRAPKVLAENLPRTYPTQHMGKGYISDAWKVSRFFFSSFF